MIKIGILGAARIAQPAMIAPVALRNDCEITVVACRDQNRGEAFAKLHGIPSIETHYESMLQRDIDLIYNALPQSRHADLSIAAAQAGKMVLCEKPFAMNAEEAQRMVRAEEQTGCPIIEAFHYRFHPAFLRMQEIINQGDIGEVESIQAKFFAPIPYRKDEIRYIPAMGGGALMDLGCYAVHWSRMIAGSEPEIVNANCMTHHSGVDLTTRAELLFDNHITAFIECSMDEQRDLHVELVVLGSKGKLHFENPLLPHTGYQITVENPAGKRIENRGSEGTTYDFQLDHVVDVIKGYVDPIGGQADAVANMIAIDAIYQLAGLPIR